MLRHGFQIAERQLGEHIPKEYSHEILYRYYWKDKAYTHDRTYRRENPWSKEKERAEAAMKKFAKNETYTGRVNPADPAEAVLAHDTKAGGYSIWFPILFVIGGLGMIGGALRKMRSNLDSTEAKN